MLRRLRVGAAARAKKLLKKEIFFSEGDSREDWRADGLGQMSHALLMCRLTWCSLRIEECGMGGLDSSGSFGQDRQIILSVLPFVLICAICFHVISSAFVLMPIYFWLAAGMRSAGSHPATIPSLQLSKVRPHMTGRPTVSCRKQRVGPAPPFPTPLSYQNHNLAPSTARPCEYVSFELSFGLAWWTVVDIAAPPVSQTGLRKRSHNNNLRWSNGVVGYHVSLTH